MNEAGSIAAGSVVGSVVGIQKYVYDVFGPAVNRAARLQQISDPMEITICGSLMGELIDTFDISPPRTEDLRGFGEVSVATLSERRPAASAIAS